MYRGWCLSIRYWKWFAASTTSPSDFVERCAAASVEGMASQEGAPPPQAAEALEAGKDHPFTFHTLSISVHELNVSDQNLHFS